MKKKQKFGLAVFILGIVFTTVFFIKSNQKGLIEYEIAKPVITNITNQIVATGKVVPKNEVEIKPQITGIIEKILIKEGDAVKAGDLLAKIKVVPNEQSLNNAESRLKNSEFILKNTSTEFERNKKLFDKGIISERDFNASELQYNQAVQDLENAKNDLQIIKLGSAGGSNIANTNIRATVNGTILEIPVKKGDQVIQANTFNAGTTIATIADLDVMIFEGKVDEAEVSKLQKEMALVITLAAIEEKKYNAALKFIAPKGNEEGGAVQFKIEAEVYLDDEYFVRAGYSANASIITEKRDSVLAISEGLLQYDPQTKKPYVEIEISNQNFEKRFIETGISDGIYVECLEGIKAEDKIKIWNKMETKKRGEESE
mgnify:FL=1